MSSPTFNNSREDFEHAFESYHVVPVHSIVDSNGIRPIDTLKALRAPGNPAFIFESESPEPGASRYAYVCPKIDHVARTGTTEPLGDVDTGTIIRSIVLRNGTAHVQGGAGIVFDSDPEAENLESLQKAKAPLLAIARAEATRDQHKQNGTQTSPESQHTATITAE